MGPRKKKARSELMTLDVDGVLGELQRLRSDELLEACVEYEELLFSKTFRLDKQAPCGYRLFLHERGTNNQGHHHGGDILLWSDLTDAERHEYEARAAKLKRLQDLIRDASARAGRRPRKSRKPRPKRPRKTSKKPRGPAKKREETPAPPVKGSDINCLRLRNRTLAKRPFATCKPKEEKPPSSPDELQATTCPPSEDSDDPEEDFMLRLDESDDEYVPDPEEVPSSPLTASDPGESHPLTVALPGSGATLAKERECDLDSSEGALLPFRGPVPGDVLFNPFSATFGCLKWRQSLAITLEMQSYKTTLQLPPLAIEDADTESSDLTEVEEECGSSSSIDLPPINEIAPYLSQQSQGVNFEEWCLTSPGSDFGHWRQREPLKLEADNAWTMGHPDAGANYSQLGLDTIVSLSSTVITEDYQEEDGSGQVLPWGEAQETTTTSCWRFDPTPPFQSDPGQGHLDAPGTGFDDLEALIEEVLRSGDAEILSQLPLHF
ncbi:uncharacterized protein LOC132197565 [Neocloeon triangulifer]|uniref:uncharacterized protein LOC132197565 n=1 Tax=Neocloeon triangulifer TaxID=2078957 RepID=UPI00286EE2C6|nr:uncharacterized protein LOC132197565 [Neocloeon triangulifer]